MAADIQHASSRSARSASRRELISVPMMLFKYTKFPNAAKEYLRFMMEAEQYEPVAERLDRLRRPSARGYENNPVWTADPKVTPYRDAEEHDSNGYAGALGYASAAASPITSCRHGRRAASGSKTPERPLSGAEARRAVLQGLSSVAAPCMTRSSAASRPVRFTDPACTRSRSRNRHFLGLMSCCPPRHYLAVPHLSALASAPGYPLRMPRSAAKDCIGLDNFLFLWGDASPGSPYSTLFSIPPSRASEVRPGPVAGAPPQPPPAVQGLLRAYRPAALHRADRAVGDRLLVDLRLPVFDHLLDAAESSGSSPSTSISSAANHARFARSPPTSGAASRSWRSCLLAGLQTISPSLLRGGHLDGASADGSGFAT